VATIYPTASIHYTKSAGDPSQLLAPPYDVIDDDAARTLRDLSPYNAVRLILPEGKAPDRYQLAASRLRRWLTEGVLARSDKDALYLEAGDRSEGDEVDYPDIDLRVRFVDGQRLYVHKDDTPY